MNTGRPRVAIGLPVYNAERYLEDALSAILAQTFTDFEVIISDNASTDRTAAICDEYARRDRRIRYVRNSTNLGAARNFNRTFELSSAPYFKWAPYDDLIEPDFLTRCVAVLDERPDVVLCYSKAFIIDEHGAVVAPYDPGPDTTSARPSQRWRNLIQHPQYAVQLMGVARADALRQTALHGGYPSSDEVLLGELALAGRWAEVPERLYRYRRHPAQSTSEPEQRRRVVFFDTSLAGKIVLPKWRYLGACMDAVGRASGLRWTERALCYAHVVTWMAVPPHARALGKDVLLAAQQWIRNRMEGGPRAPRRAV